MNSEPPIRPYSSICRDCLTQGATGECANCNSTRIVHAPDLSALSVALIDCDAFYAAIEKRDNPDLVGKPVIVGGGKRGVVATCCYIARAFGVRSAMPAFQALKLCPNAVVVKPRMQLYSEIGRQIREMMQTLTPQVLSVSIDEAYLDLTGSQRLHKAAPAETLIRFQKQVRQDIGITVSIGLSGNRFLAKLASEIDKPDGFTAVSPIEAPQRLAPMSPGAIHGVGPKLLAKLEADGFDTIGALQEAPPDVLMKRYGETGVWLRQRAFGVDHRRVASDHGRKSISSETTFHEDISDPAVLSDILWRQCVRVADGAKRKECEGHTITLKLKTARFKSITRQTSLPASTQLAQVIFRSASPLLDKLATGTAFRLLGVGISDLTPAGPADQPRDFGDLADPKAKKRAAAERAMDKARQRFGQDAVDTGRGMRHANFREARKSGKDEGG